MCSITRRPRAACYMCRHSVGWVSVCLNDTSCHLGLCLFSNDGLLLLPTLMLWVLYMEGCVCGGGCIGKNLNSSLCLPVWDTLTDWRTVHGAGRVLSSRRRVTKWMSTCYCSTDSSAHSSLTHLHHHFHSWCEQSYCRKPS